MVYAGCVKVEVRDCSQWLDNTYRVYVCMFVYPLSRRGPHFSDSTNFFSSQCSSKTKIGRNVGFIRGERKFYPDSHGIVRFCTSSTGKQAADNIMWRTCIKTFSFHHFCRSIQKFVLMTLQLNWYYWWKKVYPF